MNNSKFIDKFSAFAGKLGNQIHLRSLRDAFATIMPLYILAGLAVLFNNTVFTWVFKGEVLSEFQYWGTVVTNGTLNISALLIALMVGYYLSRNRGYENPLVVALISLASLMVMMPNTSVVIPDGATKGVYVSGIVSFTNIGTGSMFAGIIVGLIASEVFIKLSSVKKIRVNLGENVPPAVGNSFNVLIPVIVVVAGFALISAILFNFTGMNLINLITTFIQEPLRHVGTGLWGCIIIYSLGNFLWLFGIHQSVIYGAILEPLLILNITENISAYNNGQAIPNIINVSQVQTFALIGGSGSTICLLIATFIVSKNSASRSVAKLALGPGIFNINEPVIFGYPIVYNISMIIPFVFVPALGILISYMTTIMGWMSPAVIQVPWTTPMFLNAFFATAGDWRAVIVQVVIVILGIFIYIPFIKINDKVAASQVDVQRKEEN